MRQSNKRDDETPPPITDATILSLYVASGGRCSFPGCSAYVMEEPLTTKSARLGNVAHIVGESKRGPRGNDPLHVTARSDVENLMLMCTLHHSFIDKKEQEAEYTAERLREFKRRHETLIKRATGAILAGQSHAIRMVGQIRGHVIGVSDTEIRAAVFANEGRHVDAIIDVDLGTLPDGTGDAYLQTGKAKIDAELQRRILPQIEDGTIKRLSVFALARIPFLCHLGYGLGDKVPTVLYQKHRDEGEGWNWPLDGESVDFEVVEHGPVDATAAALLASVSGGDIEKVKRATRADRIIEIRPIGAAPSRTLLRSPATLENFRRAYHLALSKVEVGFPGATSVDYFLAAPAPVALLCARDVLRDVVPRVVIHDLIDGEYVAAAVLETRTMSAARVGTS